MKEKKTTNYGNDDKRRVNVSYRQNKKTNRPMVEF